MRRDRKKLLIKSAKLVWVLLVLGVLGCVDRERSNPLDPRNPSTDGQPTGLRARSEYKSIHLTWDDFGKATVTAIRIYRKLSAQTQFELIAEIDGPVRQYSDRNLEFGVTYIYQIVAVSGNYASPPSAPVTVTLGPSFIWVVDYGAGELVRFPYDLSQAEFRFGYFFSPTLVLTIPKKSQVWLADRFDRAVYRVSAEPRILAKSKNLNQVSNMAMSLLSQELWVIESGSRMISRLDLDGNQNFQFGSLENPWGIAGADDGLSAWVSDLGRKAIYRISATDSTARPVAGTLVAPRDLVLNSKSGQLWLADSTRLVVFDSNRDVVLNVFEGFQYAAELAIDSRRNECWVLEYSRANTLGKVTRVSAAGSSLAVVNQIGFPIALAVDEYDGRCYIVDAGKRQILVVTPAGGIDHQILSLGNPSDISIETQDY